MNMRALPTIICCLIAITSINGSQENCDDQPDTSCAHVSEYNAYITCIDQQRRHKRSVGCAHQAESCEYIDCQKCQETCEPDCDDCECPNSCRHCCSETCATNLCCHKTCHNQCKTNHCRTECKRECKHRINEDPDYDKNNIAITGKHNSESETKHNITTIINLHNIINNTNLIDIPIKINNTNYNNITLERDFSTGQLQAGGQTSGLIQDRTNEEKCCYVVTPRQCIKTNIYPFIKCFQHRHKKCAPYCISTIVHAQPQNYCDDSGCHKKVFYIPQAQPRCIHQQSWPFVNCGGQQGGFHNCHGCYDQHTVKHQEQPHMRCSRCYDNGYGIGPYYRQGPFYQPVYSPVPSCTQIGTCGYQAPPINAGYPGYFGYPGSMGYPPAMPSYYGYPPQGPGIGFPSYSGGEYYGDNSIPQMSGLETKSGDYPENEIKYPAGNYVHETIISLDDLNSTVSVAKTLPSQSGLKATTNTVPPKSRYALISIDAPNSHHQDKKEKRIKRKKDKAEHDEKLETEDSDIKEAAKNTTKTLEKDKEKNNSTHSTNLKEK